MLKQGLLISDFDRTCSPCRCSETRKTGGQRPKGRGSVAHMKIEMIFLVPLIISLLAKSATFAGYLVAVSNERSGTISFVESESRAVVATIPVGKRPRGIHASPDGKSVFVALSGTPISGPPPLDAQRNPVFQKEDPANSDHAADGIGIIDVRLRKLVRVIPSGSDPEQFAVSGDGKRLYISNEDVGLASVVNVADGAVISTIHVKEEPEGVALSPDGERIFITCETHGEVCVVDARDYHQIGQFVVPGRPRNVAFLADGSRAFVPSESKGAIHVIDTATFKTDQVISLPKGSRPMDLLLVPEVNRLFVSNGRAGTVSVIDTTDLKVRKTIGVGKRPWGMALGPDQRYIYVGNGPSNDISIINVKSEEEEARVKTGESPWGVAVVRDFNGDTL
jgi:YVTN family beta-propeller protein